MNARVLLVMAAIALPQALWQSPAALGQTKVGGSTVQVERYVYLVRGPFVIMVDMKTDKTYTLTGPNTPVGRGFQVDEFAWAPITKFEEFDSDVVGRWQLDEIGGKKLKETEIFSFHATGRLHYSYTRGKLDHSFNCTYRITGKNKMLILLPQKEKQELTWHIDGKLMTMTDVQTKEVSKFTRLSD